MRGKEKIVRALQLPEDYQRGRALVRMEGRERVCVENFKGICSCTADKISLAAGENRIHIIGKRLRIDCYTKEEIEISGLIETVTYLS